MPTMKVIYALEDDRFSILNKRKPCELFMS